MVCEMSLVLYDRFSGDLESSVPQTEARFSNVQAVGRLLSTDYVYPFELASVILLVGIVAATALTLRGKRVSKSVSPADQVFVQAKDRVRVLQMPSEAREAKPAPVLKMPNVKNTAWCLLSAPHKEGIREATCLTLSHFLILGAILLRSASSVFF